MKTTYNHLGNKILGEIDRCWQTNFHNGCRRTHHQSHKLCRCVLDDDTLSKKSVNLIDEEREKGVEHIFVVDRLEQYNERLKRLSEWGELGEVVNVKVNK